MKTSWLVFGFFSQSSKNVNNQEYCLIYTLNINCRSLMVLIRLLEVGGLVRWQTSGPYRKVQEKASLNLEAFCVTRQLIWHVRLPSVGRYTTTVSLNSASLRLTKTNVIGWCLCAKPGKSSLGRKKLLCFRCFPVGSFVTYGKRCRI